MRIAALAVFSALASSGAFAQTPDFSGTFPVNGRNMYIECFGSGTPTVVFVTGEGGRTSDYREYTGVLGHSFKTCAYNRVRFDTISTAEVFTADLKGLVEAAGIERPFVLLGHSAGGMMVQHYAKTYPADLLGVISVNQVPPARIWLEATQPLRTPEVAANEQAYFEGDNGEPFDYVTSSAQIAALPTPDLPFEVVQSTVRQCEDLPVCVDTYPIEERIIAELAASWPRGNFTSVDALHNISVEEMTAAVERVLAAR
jgi:pimeloyl-ACP methyl ester carboxylesterase